MGHSHTSVQYVPVVLDRPLVPLMNDTKWDELRLAMHEIEGGPEWSTVERDVGYRYGPDSDWFYHFRLGPYETILYVDIATPSTPLREAVRLALTAIHVPGEETDGGFRVYGYAAEGQAVGYI